MRALVCGGRDYTDRARLFAVLDKLHAQLCFTCIIEGEQRGADLLAREWAEANAVSVAPFPALWIHGHVAGITRNGRMLAQGKPDVVIAFPGNRGTIDMVCQAKAAGVRIIFASRAG